MRAKTNSPSLAQRQVQAGAPKANSYQLSVAKKLASAAEDQAGEQCRVLEKAQKRLAKALKKLGQGKGKQKGQVGPAARRRSPIRAPQAGAKETTRTGPKTQKRAAGKQSPSAAAGGAAPPLIIPTV